MMKLSLPLLTIASLAAVSVQTRASADTIPFDKIPVIPAPAAPPPAAATPAPKPDKIPATEKVDGIYPAVLPAKKRQDTEKEGYRNIYVFTNEKDQRDYVADGTYNQPIGTTAGPQTCLSTSSTGDDMSPHVSYYYRTKPYDWELKEQKKPGAKPAPKNNVRAIRQERMTVDGDTVTLENVEALVDLETLGVRLQSKTTTKLTKVGAGPSGMVVFAARDEKGATRFLVTHPELPAPPSEDVRQAFVNRLSDAAERLSVQMPSGGVASSGCGHVRFTLSTKAGGGEMATVLATAFLPPAKDLDEAPPDDREKEQAADDEGDSSFEASQRKQRLRVQRARTVAVNVSLSQLASEENPLLSVTFGWAGTDRKLSF